MLSETIIVRIKIATKATIVSFHLEERLADVFWLLSEIMYYSLTKKIRKRWS